MWSCLLKRDTDNSKPRYLEVLANTNQSKAFSLFFHFHLHFRSLDISKRVIRVLLHGSSYQDSTEVYSTYVFWKKKCGLL